MTAQPAEQLNLFQRFGAAWQAFRVTLRAVLPVPVGSANDGLVQISGGTAMDRPWGEVQQQFTDALEAWRVNPLAKRIVGLITAYSIGDGVTLSAEYAPLSKFLTAFWSDPLNGMLLRQQQWSDELSRSGELFITLHTNPASGMSYVRAIPAKVIDKIEFRPGDYETELSYHEAVGLDDPDYANGGRIWLSPEHEDADKLDGGKPRPLMLHFAVNRPVGCVRGESDLAPILTWLRRYHNWLEDRVRLNSVARAFVWLVTVAGGKVTDTRNKYIHPPEPGSVLVAERDGEQWSVMAPDLKAQDVSADGKAIRWMIVAGSPGMGLIDLGEADEANLASAKAMSEQRRRFMAARQAYFGHALAQVALTAYNRAVRLGLWKGKEKALQDLKLTMPDIASEDNGEQATAAHQAAQALTAVQAAGVSGPKFTGIFLRQVLELLGRNLEDAELDAILQESGTTEDQVPGGVTNAPVVDSTPGEAAEAATLGTPALTPAETAALGAVAVEFNRAAYMLAQGLERANGSDGHG